MTRTGKRTAVRLRSVRARLALAATALALPALVAQSAEATVTFGADLNPAG
jgi:hypothetical protein